MLPTTPKLVVDGIVYYRNGILIIERKHPPLGLALIGGFVDVGETCEQAVVREVKEETGVDAYVRELVGVYSEPDRDERGHLVTVAYLLEADNTNEIVPQDSEVKNVSVFTEGEILGELGYKLICDHRRIFLNALWKKENMQW
jgi:8-oxo-dGTP diphosphatase